MLLRSKVLPAMMRLGYHCCYTTVTKASRTPQIVYETVNVIVLSLPVTPLGMNQYLLGCKQLKEAALIDCGCIQPQRWIAAAAENDMRITSILQTHGHVDHVCGLRETKNMLPNVPIFAHNDDWYVIKTAPLQGLLMGVHCPMPPSVDNYINDGDEIKIGKLGVTVVHCPGHSPGHVAFFVATESTKPLLFCGDLIFEGSIGRTDFPGCDPHAMEKSLMRLKTFPRETTLFPGHRGLTSVGAELDTNPFL